LLIAFALATVGLIQANRARAALEIERDAARSARDEAEQANLSAQEQRKLAEARAEEARNEADKSLTVSQFLHDMLGSVDPSKALGREVTVRYMLDEAARKIDEGALAEQPEVEAAVRMTLGETYQALGLYDAAELQLRVAEAMCRAQLGDEHPDTLCSSHALARVLRVKGKFAEAEALLRRTAETQRRKLGEEHRETLATMTELALALWGPGRFAEAEEIHRRTLEIQRRVLGEERIDTLESMGHLGAVCRVLGKSAEAETLLRRALAVCQRVLGEEHPCTADAMNNLGLLLEDQREYEQAEALYRQTYEVDRRVLGADHPRTQIPMNNLLRVLQLQAKVAEIRELVADRLDHLRRMAERLDADALALHAYAWELLNCEPADLRDAEEALPVAQRAVEMDGGRDVNMLDTLALAFQMTGDLDQAIETQRRAIVQAQAGGPYNQAELKARLVDLLLANGDLVGAATVSWGSRAQQLGESLITDPALGASLVLRSQALIEEGRFEEAAALLRGCLATRQKALPEGHWLIADTMSQLGGAVAGAGKFAEAEALLLDGYAGMADNRRVLPDRKRQAIERIIRLYEAWDKPDQASEWRRRLGEAAEDAAGQN